MSQPLAFLHGAFGRIGLVEMDSDLAVHVHHHLHVVIKAGGADTRFRVRGRALPVTEDNAVLVNAWEPHAWRRSGEAAPTLFLTLYLEPCWLAAAGFDTSLENGRAFFAASTVRLTPAARRVVGALVERLAAAWPLPEGGLPGGDLTERVAALVGELQRSSDVASGRAPPVRAFDYRIRRALDLLNEQPGAVRLDGVARNVGLSRPRFFELFQECTGFTPSRLVNAVRMERAIGRLTTSRDPMAELALDLGFATQGNFSRFFKQQIGVSPHSFRSAAVPVAGGDVSGLNGLSRPSFE